jgi:glucose-1-phosphate thymidylyltransferase
MSGTRKGIILAGGSGTRLAPVTRVVSKQLLPVFDKPMIYYPLSTLMLSGIRDVLVITTPADAPLFAALLGDGSAFGMRITHAAQAEPRGIADALIIAEEWLDGMPSALILGDNIFYGHGLPELLQNANADSAGATIFGYYVHDAARYGVAEIDERGGILGLEEKPSIPRSNYAITGLYFYDADACAIARSLKPSSRGEIEITDVNIAYLEAGKLRFQVLGRGMSWLDTGTCESLLEASVFVESLERRQGLKICCPEEIAFRLGWITHAELRALGEGLQTSSYGRYLLAVADNNGPLWRIPPSAEPA